MIVEKPVEEINPVSKPTQEKDLEEQQKMLL